MSAPCKNFLRTLLPAFWIGISPLSAASLRWVHLGTIDAGLAGLAIDGKIAYREMPPGKATPWGKVTPGSHSFQIASGKNHGSTFELEIVENQKITIVSVSDKNGDIQCRTFGLDAPQGEFYVLNMIPGAMMSLPEPGRDVISGKGLWLPDAKQAKTTVSLADAGGFRGEVDFSRLGAAPKSPYLAILSRNDDGKPSLAMLRDHDSLFEMSDGNIGIPGELLAGIRVISEGNALAAGSFDPAGVNWDEVESRIFWLNLSIGRDPCRLEVRGFPAMRRMPSGRGSGFVKWPAGSWDAGVVDERTGEKLAANSFSLSDKASLGLISSGGGVFSNRLLVLEGRAAGKNGSRAKSQIRFVNALPDGTLRATVQYAPNPKTLALKPGEVGNTIQLVEGGFPGATIDFTFGAAKNQVIGKVPAMRPMSPGDWVVVVHLNHESLASPVLTWVEMDKGSITSQPASGSGE